MLSKPAILLLGMIQESPKGAYEITKRLEQMNIKWWFQISDSTVYSTLITLGKKLYTTGSIEKNGNMPERTVYHITALGRETLLEAIREVLTTIDYDATSFSIAATYMNLLEREEVISILQMRMKLLEKYQNGIQENVKKLQKAGLEDIIIDNIARMGNIIKAELESTERMLDTLAGKEY